MANPKDPIRPQPETREEQLRNYRKRWPEFAELSDEWVYKIGRRLHHLDWLQVFFDYERQMAREAARRSKAERERRRDQWREKAEKEAGKLWKVNRHFSSAEIAAKLLKNGTFDDLPKKPKAGTVAKYISRFDPK